MRPLILLTSLAFLTVGVESHPPVAKHARGSSDLSVSLAPVPGHPTQVNATFKNNGDSDLSLLKIGTILDDRPVEKLAMTDDKGNKVPFLGIRLSLSYERLQTEHFEDLLAGSSIFRVIDLSAMYDLEPGTYSVFAEGTLPSASADSKTWTPITLRSEAISIKINAPSSVDVRQKKTKRTIIEKDSCTAEQLETTANAVRNCEILARAAAADASDVHSARFVEYFKSNATQTREHVKGRLLAVAEECSTLDKGNTRIFCKDDVGYCESAGPLIAYTTWVNGYIVMCPLFYETQPPLPEKCHKQDHATTTIHEMTHARAVYEQEVSTQDYAYGYENSTALDALSSLYNADQYSLYANAVYLDC